MEKKKILAIISLVAAIVLFIGLTSFAGPCPVTEGEMPMKCHWTGQALKGLAVVMALSSILKLVSKDRGIAIGISLVEVINGIYAILIPTVLIGTCMHEEMMCNTGMKPFVIIISLIYIVLAAVNIYMNKK